MFKSCGALSLFPAAPPALYDPQSSRSAKVMTCKDALMPQALTEASLAYDHTSSTRMFSRTRSLRDQALRGFFRAPRVAAPANATCGADEKLCLPARSEAYSTLALRLGGSRAGKSGTGKLSTVLFGCGYIVTPSNLHRLYSTYDYAPISSDDNFLAASSDPGVYYQNPSHLAAAVWTRRESLVCLLVQSRPRPAELPEDGYHVGLCVTPMPHIRAPLHPLHWRSP
ncbi:hypothetical protein EI94DRAFT_784686 [Lactarius quietus]|nr:hypothetical protein EI94DRAFT_784686 [Lactarius quietus]